MDYERYEKNGVDLKEYVFDYMQEIGCKEDIDDVIEIIKDEARKLAKGGSCAVWHTNINKIIDKCSELIAKKKQEKSESKSERKVVKNETTKSKETYKSKVVSTSNTQSKPTASNNNDSEFDFSQLGLF